MNPLCDLLEDYFDDELAGDRLAEFVEHLSACETCRAELVQLQNITLSVRSAWESVELKTPSLNVISPSEMTQESFYLVYRMIAAIAAMLLVGLGIQQFYLAPGLSKRSRVNPASTSSIPLVEVVEWESEEPPVFQRVHATVKVKDAYARQPVVSGQDFTFVEVTPRF